MTSGPDLASSSVTATAAFYERSSAVGALRTALRMSQRLWPSLAVRMAQALFLTPLPLKWLQRGDPWGPAWQVEALPFEGASVTLYRPSARATATAATDAPAAGDPQRPTVLLTHGWAGHARQLQPLAEALLAAGLDPVIVEMPGHGRSSGWRSSLPQFARALDYVANALVARGARLRAVVAHSLGGSAAAHAMARGLPAERLVLIAAPDAPRDYTFMFARVFGLTERTRAAMQGLIESREGLWMSQFDAAWSAPRVGQPTLIVHDDDDTVNVAASATRLAAHMTRRELYRTRGLGHRRVLKDADVLARVRSFVVNDPWGG